MDTQESYTRAIVVLIDTIEKDDSIFRGLEIKLAALAREELNAILEEMNRLQTVIKAQEKLIQAMKERHDLYTNWGG